MEVFKNKSVDFLMNETKQNNKIKKKNSRVQLYVARRKIRAKRKSMTGTGNRAQRPEI